MHYEGIIIRPPSEADSIILQVTVGCSHNKCTFCGTYKGTAFRIKDPAVIDEDLAFAARYCRRQRRVFLADGDALIMPQEQLTVLLDRLRSKLPWVSRISLYGNAKSILMKSTADLRKLKEKGLDRVYLGLESGSDNVLKRIRKGVDSRAMIRAAQRVREAGIFLSVTVLLGISGWQDSADHARATSEVLNEMNPNQIAALTLILLENTPLFDDAAAGRFVLPDQAGILTELRALVAGITLNRVQFQANHASNYLLISGRLNRDRKSIIAYIDKALAGKLSLTPEYQRQL